VFLVFGNAAALGLRVAAAGGGAPVVFAVFAWVHISLFVFHLLPIPGLDGARMVALTLPPSAREVYRNGDKYLPLWVLLAVFVLGFILQIQQVIASAICDGVAGVSCIDAIL
jgi:membrane-associated protease RseP (regulator of RpoE activity)